MPNPNPGACTHRNTWQIWQIYLTCVGLLEKLFLTLCKVIIIEKESNMLCPVKGGVYRTGAFAVDSNKTIHLHVI